MPTSKGGMSLWFFRRKVSGYPFLLKKDKNSNKIFFKSLITKCQRFLAGKLSDFLQISLLALILRNKQ